MSYFAAGFADDLDEDDFTVFFDEDDAVVFLPAWMVLFVETVLFVTTGAWSVTTAAFVSFTARSLVAPAGMASMGTISVEPGVNSFIST